MIVESFFGMGFAGEIPAEVDAFAFVFAELANEFAFAFSIPIPSRIVASLHSDQFDSFSFLAGVWRCRPPRKPQNEFDELIRAGVRTPVGC